MEPQTQSIYTDIRTTEGEKVYLEPTREEAVKIGLAGFIVGLLVPLLGYWLDHFFVRPVFCSSGDPLGLCSGSTAAAYATAAVLCGIAAVILMVNWQVFRPLPIVAAVVISFWGMQAFFKNDQLVYYLLSAGLYAAAFLLFYWLLRLHSFIVSIVLVVALVVAIRIVLVV